MDETGREIKPAVNKKEDYDVGVFYHLWHGDFGADEHAQSPNSVLTSIKDIQKMLDNGETDKLWSDTDVQHFYYWGEPLYGYYLPSDRWVLTRHIELFTMANLDFVCVDMTNDCGDDPRIFEFTITQFLEVLLQYNNQGFSVPKVVFYTNTMSDVTVKALYNAFYKSGKYNDIWYAPSGKPMIIGITDKNANGTNQDINKAGVLTTDRTLLNYFDFKDSKWPNRKTNLSAQTNAFPWISWSRYAGENAGYGLDFIEVHSLSNGAKRDGFAAVSVGQQGQLMTKSGVIACQSTSASQDESHRGYDIYEKKIKGDWKEGLAAQQLWNEVVKKKDKIKTVMVTGWNEWIAQKQPALAEFNYEYRGRPESNTVGTHFVDVFSKKYSRDMEMMRDVNGYGDNYYLQLAYNTRRLKMTNQIKTNFPTSTVALDGDTLAALWGNKGTEYLDFNGDAIARSSWDSTGKTIFYEDKSNRNDIVKIKVTNDDSYYYFYVETALPITDYESGTNWMNILIGTEYGANTFGGFNYVINRAPNGNTTSVHKYTSSGWQQVGTADLRVDFNMMMVRVPMSTLGRSSAQRQIRFKVSDNVQNWFVDKNTEHIMDYYVSGDSAPIGRLGYVYGC